VKSDARGQTTVEFVLCLPFVVLAFAVLVEVTLLGIDRARVWQAAREAARVAVVDPEPEEAVAAAERVGPGSLDITVDPPSHLRRQGEALEVSVVTERDGAVPLIGELFDGIVLEAAATMRIEVP
jgi:hypothetical protein